jgi:hypothetical protein
MTSIERHINIPFRHNPYFMGRDAELAQLDTAMQQYEPVGLVGMGGIGKTQLAAEYALRSIAAYPDGIFWISVAPLLSPNSSASRPDVHSRYELGLMKLLERLTPEQQHEHGVRVYQQRFTDNVTTARLYGDNETLRTDRSQIIDRLEELSWLTLNIHFNELCGTSPAAIDRESTTFADGFARLGRALLPDSTDDSSDQLIRRAFTYLREHPRALLIVDNLDQPADLCQPIIDEEAPVSLQCSILFTSRLRDPYLSFVYIDVGGLPHLAARDLLLHRRRRTDSKLDLDTADTICHSLGYLPLALALAAAYLGKFPAISLAGYLRRLKKDGGLVTLHDIDVNRPILPTRHGPVESTLRLQWEALKSDDLRRILHTAALPRASAHVPRAHLSLLTGLDDQADDGYVAPLDKALTDLRDFSLIEELSDRSLRLHPLVQEFADGHIPATTRELFRSQIEANLVAALADRAQRQQYAITAGECLRDLRWNTPQMRTAVLAALRELVSDEHAPDQQRRTAAFLLISLDWIRYALDITTKELLIQLDLIARYIDTPSQADYLIRSIDSVPAASIDKRQRAQLLVYRAGIQGQAGKLDAAASDYEQAKQCIGELIESQNEPSKDLKFAARIDLGAGNIARRRAEELIKPEDRAQRQARLREAVGLYGSAAQYAHDYHDDVILEVTICGSLIYTYALLHQWEDAETAYRSSLEILKNGRSQINDQVAYDSCHAQIVNTASQMYYKKGLAEYEAAYNLAKAEIALLEESFKQSDDSVLVHDLILTHINAGDYLYAMSTHIECTVAAPLTTACEHWQIALDKAHRLGISDREQEASERLERYCRNKATTAQTPPE